MAQEIFATQNSNTYSAELTRRAVFAQYARTAANTPGIISGGLISATDLQLSAPGSGMSVNVGTGEAIIGGSEGGVQGGYYARNIATQNLSITASNPTNPRIDTVVFTAGDSLYTEPSDVTAGTNAAVLAVVTGTPTAGATLANLSGAAAVPLSSLVLGYVLVPANSSNVTAGNISNVASVVQPLSPGLLGATAASRYVGATASGAPTMGTFKIGDFVIDQTGLVWVCTSAGSPGTWTSSSALGNGAGHALQLRPITGTSATLNPGWQTISFSFTAFPNTCLVASGAVGPVTNGSDLSQWAIGGFTNGSLSFFLNPAATDTFRVNGLALGY